MSKRPLTQFLHGLIPVVVLASLLLMLLPTPGMAAVASTLWNAPTVVTSPASAVTARQAVLNGNLTSLGNLNVVAIEGGTRHSLALCSDGTLWAWGWNSEGELGLGDTTDRLTPTQVGSATNWVAISGGMYYSLGLRSDGTLWAWGKNGEGQLGLGDTTNRLTPTQVGSAANWVAVSAAADHCLGLRSDGTLWAWGRNYMGQLGQGDTAQRLTPTRVGNAANWTAISSGWYYSLALRSNGTLWDWGDNHFGELGLGDTTNRLTPTQVGNATNWAVVSANEFHSFGLRSDHTLWAWGQNDSSELGVGDTTNRLAPTRVGSATDWAAVSAGVSHSLGLRSDGTLWSWGWNYIGQLGLGDTTDRLAPTQVGGVTDWAAVSAGQSHSLGLRSDGSLWSWGLNFEGELGLGDTTNRLSPTQVPDTIVPCHVSFEWGLTTAYGNTTTSQTMTGAGVFSTGISGLTPGTTYHFRAKAVGDGTSYGDDMTFTTTSGVPAAPTLSSPANGANVPGTSVTFQWNASPGATKYFLIVSTNPSLDVTGSHSCVRKFWGQLGNVTQYTVTGFPNNGTTYYWWVYAGNSYGWCNRDQVLANGGWSLVNGTGGGTPTIPAAPTLSSPANGASVSGTSVTFQWNASPGATKYFLIVSTNPSLDVTGSHSCVRKSWGQLGNVTQYTVTGFPNNGTTYYWWVYAGNSYGWCNRDQVLANGGWSLVNGTGGGTPAVPAAPTLSSPANGASVSGTSVTFQWNASPGATKYFLIVSTNPSLDVTCSHSCVRKFWGQLGNVTQYTVTGFPNNGTTYYCWVYAGNSYGWCNRDQVLASGGWSFTNKP